MVAGIFPSLIAELSERPGIGVGYKSSVFNHVIRSSVRYSIPNRQVFHMINVYKSVEMMISFQIGN